MVALFLLLRVFCVCPQPDVSEKISITVINNYHVRAYAHFPAIGTMLDSSFVSVLIGSLGYRHLI